MRVTDKKYRLSVSFCRKLGFLGKTEGKHFWILNQIFNFFKPIKTYMEDHYVQPI
jgi:hypothetical protein